MNTIRTVVCGVLAVAVVVSACGRRGGSSSRGGGFDVSDLPRYPGAVPDQAVGQGDLGQVVREYTTDSFDAVAAFFSRNLAEHAPASMSQASELGAQRAFSFEKGGRMVSVVVQEFRDERRVGISYMVVGF